MMAKKLDDSKNEIKIKELESQLSKLKYELEDVNALLAEEQKLHQYYQLVADFTFGWEIWVEPDHNIKYCSPSCFDLTGFTANQVIESGSISGLLVYEADRTKFIDFLISSLDQLIVNQALKFRILTRHKQLRWCSMNIRAVYNKEGRYLGIRTSIHDITHLKAALGHIKNLSIGKEIEQRAKLRFKSELDLKERELVSFLLQLSQKNELIVMVKKQLNLIAYGNSKNGKEKIVHLLRTLGEIPEVPVNWEMVKMKLEKLYPGFFEKLLSKHPTLTPKEIKLCAYLRLNLSSKEISGLQNIAYKSVEIARVRLRKKLKLSRENRLVDYIKGV
ncbi:MAG: PAS domain S-box protein [Bacteroidales bacterium]|nr:PAS domain S-box protein [Bacteroidales bacterium]